MSSLVFVKVFLFCHVFMPAVFSFSAIGSMDHGFGKHDGGTLFIEHVHFVLDVEPEISVSTYDKIMCAFKCLHQSFCLSFNYDARSPGNNSCELLSKNKYTLSERFQPSQFFNHYSLMSPCENDPCKKGAKCNPLYGSNGYYCERSPGSIEQGSPWIKLNKDVVCFGAKNDAFGNFNVTSHGTILTMRLVYISGFVTCNSRTVPYGSHWACKKGSNIATIVTSAAKNVIFPEDYKNKSYSLVGYHANSSELVFPPRSKPLKVTNGEEYQIWYNEDFVNGEEFNNDGQTCVNVYALYDS